MRPETIEGRWRRPVPPRRRPDPPDQQDPKFPPFRVGQRWSCSGGSRKIRHSRDGLAGNGGNFGVGVPAGQIPALRTDLPRNDGFCLSTRQIPALACETARNDGNCPVGWLGGSGASRGAYPERDGGVGIWRRLSTRTSLKKRYPPPPITAPLATT